MSHAVSLTWGRQCTGCCDCLEGALRRGPHRNPVCCSSRGGAAAKESWADRGLWEERDGKRDRGLCKDAIWCRATPGANGAPFRPRCCAWLRIVTARPPAPCAAGAKDAWSGPAPTLSWRDPSPCTASQSPRTPVRTTRPPPCSAGGRGKHEAGAGAGSSWCRLQRCWLLSARPVDQVGAAVFWTHTQHPANGTRECHPRRLMPLTGYWRAEFPMRCGASQALHHGSFTRPHSLPWIASP